MATTTLNDIQTQIALDFDSSSSAPATSNTEWTRRLYLINRYEKEWARVKDGRWSQLLTPFTISTVAGTAYVSLPADYVFGREIVKPNSFMDIGGVDYRMVAYTEKDKYDTADSYVYILGDDQAGYKLYINPTPDTAVTVTLPYYSTYLATSSAGVKQNVLTTGTDITRCPDPMYIVYMTLADLFKIDDEGNKGLDFERKGTERLADMMSVENGRSTNFNMEIPDFVEDAGYPNIGE
jgi:hypothetical protein